MKKLLGLVGMTFLAVAAFAADKPRVYVTDSNSWEMGGGSASPFGGDTHGGARPQTAEIVKTFNERCPDIVINNKQEKADYVVVLEHEGGKVFILRDNKVALYNKSGDAIMSGSTRSLGNAVKDVCTAVLRDWPSARERAAREAAAAEAQKQTAKN